MERAKTFQDVPHAHPREIHGTSLEDFGNLIL